MSSNLTQYCFFVRYYAHYYYCWNYFIIVIVIIGSIVMLKNYVPYFLTPMMSMYSGNLVNVVIIVKELSLD